MNYLITGGSGYLGSELIKTLDSENNNIINIDIIPSENQNSKNYNIDILDEKSVEEIFKNNKIDCIIHNLAKVPLAKNKKIFKKVNIKATEIILKFFNKFKIKKLIFISSSAVYGVPLHSPITESTAREPAEPYGESKKISEDLCFDEIKKGKNIIILRPRTIIGLNRFGIFSILFDWIKNDLPIPVFSNGLNFYQFVDIRDLSEAVKLSSVSDYTGAINIGSSDVKRIIEILNFLKTKFNSKSKIKNVDNSIIIKIGFIFQKLGLIPLHDYHFKVYGKDVYFDIEHSNKVLNWKPKYSTFNSFEDSYNHFLKEDKKDEKNKSLHQKKIKNFLMKYVTLIL